MGHSETYSDQVRENVASAIALAGTSVNKVAAGTGIPQATLSRRMNGSHFAVSELEAIAQFLSIEVEVLVKPKTKVSAA